MKEFSFVPSSGLRQELEKQADRAGVSQRLADIWDRYYNLLRREVIPLKDDERAVLVELLEGIAVDAAAIEVLESEIYDGIAYQGGSEAAKRLLAKVEASTYSQRLATVESLGF